MSSTAGDIGIKNPALDWHPSYNPWLIAVSVMCATFMEVLDTSVANVSLPHIAGTLSASTDEATWVLTSYLVSNAIILPATNWLSSFFGRKQLLVTCIIIFTVASAMCGAATSLGLLITARVIQGIGGGVLQPSAQAVLLESFPPEKRGEAMALYGMGIIVAPIIGPTLGGWITDNYSWRWIFYINVPVGIVAAMMVQSFVENPPYIRRAARQSIDYIGFSLMALWLATLQLILDKGQEEDWFASSFIVWLTIISLISLIAFVFWELRVKEPIVDLRVLKNRNFGTGILLMTVVGAVLYATIAQLPIFLQTLLGYPALQSGLTLSPRGISSMLSMMIIGRLVAKIDNRILMAFGFLVLALSVYMLTDLTLQIDKSSIVWPNLISGFAMGFIFVPMSTMTMSTLRREQIGNATGIYSLMRNLGGSLGISLSTTLLARGAQAHQAMLVSHLTPYDPMYQQRLQQMQGALSSQMDPAAAAAQANAMIYGMTLRQATLLAFIDTFWLLVLLCACCIPLVFLFRKVKAKGHAAASAAH